MTPSQAPSRLSMIWKLGGLMAARLFAPFASFLLVVAIARYWGTEALGQYNTVWVWLTLFHYASVLGIGEYLVREGGANRRDVSKYLTHGLLFGLHTSLPCALIMAGLAVALGYADEVRLGMVVAALAVPFSVGTFICHAIFTAVHRVRYIIASAVLENLLLLVLGVAVIHLGYRLVGLLGVVVVVRLAGSALNLFLAHRHVAPVRLRGDVAFFRKLLPTVAVFGLTAIATQVFWRVDIILLSKLADMASIGLYSSASKLRDLSVILPGTFYSLALPIAAEGYRAYRESVHAAIEGYTRQLFVLVFLFAGFGFVFAEDILVLIYGPSFGAACSVLQILMIVVVVHSLEIVCGMSCQAAGYHRATMVLALGRLTICAALNLALIPLWGISGAALANLAAGALSFAALRHVMNRVVGSLRWLRILTRPALVCLLSTALFVPLRTRLDLVILGPMYLALYSGILFALNGFSLERLKRV